MSKVWRFFTFAPLLKWGEGDCVDFWSVWGEGATSRQELLEGLVCAFWSLEEFGIDQKDQEENRECPQSVREFDRHDQKEGKHSDGTYHKCANIHADLV